MCFFAGIDPFREKNKVPSKDLFLATRLDVFGKVSGNELSFVAQSEIPGKTVLPKSAAASWLETYTSTDLR